MLWATYQQRLDPLAGKIFWSPFWSTLLAALPVLTRDIIRERSVDLVDPAHAAVINGDAKITHSLTEQALGAGVDPLTLVNDYLIPAMDEVGRRFECHDYFVPELLISARAMKADGFWWSDAALTDKAIKRRVLREMISHRI